MAVLSDRLADVLGAASATPLAEQFGMHTVDDLLRHYPRRYSDGMTVRTDGQDLELDEGRHVTFVDTITDAVAKPMRRQPGKRPRRYLVVTLARRNPTVTATFFNADWLIDTLPVGTRLMLSGEVSYFRNVLQLTHPGFLVLDSPVGREGAGSKALKAIAATRDGEDDLLAAFDRDFFPIYPASAKVQSWDVYACVRHVLSVLDPVPEPLPESVTSAMDLMTEDAALRAIHLAESVTERERARRRLTVDEAVGLQWALLERRHGEAGRAGPVAPRRDDGLAAALHRRLPFALTEGQCEVLAAISAELARDQPMHRMLQGEVGSGKTIVSLLAMAQMVDAGRQCALLAPTEVLAVQHAASIRAVLGPLAMAGELGAAEGATRVALLTGSMSAAQKRAARTEIASGAAGLVVGTHALIQDDVEFADLGLVVVDEQHRFGVAQRDALRNKARGDGDTPMTAHLLVMTATPIPRTVALTTYGDLETSELRELPRGRQPITTTAVFTGEQRQRRWLDRGWQRIREEVAGGRQAYVVASRIDESDGASGSGSSARSGKGQDANGQNGPKPTTVLELLEGLGGGPLAGLRLGLMHGRLSGEEKDAVMSAFRAGEVDVLVCTTVIEVGVDVPNATVMVVMDADRFGISQLHQLRGRIGRGSQPGLCLLVTRLPEGSRAGNRLRAVSATQDGFALADLDLAERQEGDVLGLSQSGRPVTLRLLSLAEHRELIEEARELAARVYAADPTGGGPGGIAVLAAPFTAGERVEYLDKA